MFRSLLHAFYTLSLLFGHSESFNLTPPPRISSQSSNSARATPSFRQSIVLNASPSSKTTSTASKSSTTTTFPANVERTIVKLGRRGNTDDALQTYHSLEKPTVRQMNAAMDACARARPTRLKECFTLLQEGIEMHSLRPNVFTFGALMSACSRAQRADQAIQVLQDMENVYNVKPNAVVYCSAISACARSNPPQWETALELLEQAEKDINVVGYNAALSACARAGQWQPAINLLEKMKALPPHITPDAVTYGTILAACESGKQWHLVLKYAERLQEPPLSLDGLSLTSVLHACQQLGMAQEALHYLEVMKSSLDEPSQQRMTSGHLRKGVKSRLKGPDAVAYRLVISACARGGLWRQGIEVLQELLQTHPKETDVVAFTAAITGCEYAGEWKHAFSLLEKMRRHGVKPNQVSMAAVISACAVASMNYVKAGDAHSAKVPKQKALQLIQVMKKDASVVDPNIVVYNAAIRACGEALDLKEAMQLLEEAEQAGLEPTQVTYGSLMTACERVGDLDGASKVFKRMRNAGVEPNEIIYGAAISCCRKAGDPERALLLLRKMIREELSPNVATFNTVIVAQTEGRKADLQRGLLVFKLMRSKQYSSAFPNRQTYNILIRGLAANQEPVGAETLIRTMQADGFTPDVDLYTATVTAYEKTGQPLKALQLMESMQAAGYDFYEIEVLDRAFKKAVKLVNAVGRGLSSKEKESVDEFAFDVDARQGEGDAFIQGRAA